MQLVAEGVSFSYTGQPLLDDVTLHCELGEAVAIMGPSGEGKSTLLALLGELLTPDAGRVGIVDDDGVWSPPGSSVAWVLQTVNMFPARSVVDNVAVGAFTRGLSRADATERAQAALDRLGLTGREADQARLLSGGELQRMVVARGLISAAPFILADEPTGQLDDDTTQQVLQALLDCRPDKGLVVVTHDPAVARRCDRTLRLARHRLHDDA